MFALVLLLALFAAGNALSFALRGQAVGAEQIHAALGAYLLGTLCLGLWFARRNRSTTDYFSAGRRIHGFTDVITSSMYTFAFTELLEQALAETARLSTTVRNNLEHFAL